MATIRSLILDGFGINCAIETAAAYRLAGAETEVVHLHKIFSGLSSILDFDIITFPGGFSFGDDLGAGRVLANSIKYRKLPSGRTFFQELLDFLDSGKFILGICNGFQALVTLGLLPGLDNNYQQQVSLSVNHSGKFEDRWCFCHSCEAPSTPLLPSNLLMELPVRHKEGRMIVQNLPTLFDMITKRLIPLKYSDCDSRATLKYPLNPNGSFLSCAGMTNPTGQILGMMPHPEAFLSIYNHPNWGNILRRNPNHSCEGMGLLFFRHIVEKVETFRNKEILRGLHA